MFDGAILTAIADRLGASVAPPVAPYRPLRVDGADVAFLTPERAARLAAFSDVFVARHGVLAFAPLLGDAASRSAAVHRVARTLADEGRLSRWRDEPYAVAASYGKPALFLLERAAARYFGIRTYAVHVNGFTVLEGNVHLWIARRSDRKPIDPGQLDNLVGGGVAAGIGVRATLVKEAYEEAGIDEALAERAVPAGEIGVCREQPDGLQLETIFAHDLALPGDFVPRSMDGEVAGWRLEPVQALGPVLAARDGPDLMTADASLVTVDWLLRGGHVRGPARERLAALLRPPSAPPLAAR